MGINWNDWVVMYNLISIGFDKSNKCEWSHNSFSNIFFSYVPPYCCTTFSNFWENEAPGYLASAGPPPLIEVLFILMFETSSFLLLLLLLSASSSLSASYENYFLLWSWTFSSMGMKPDFLRSRDTRFSSVRHGRPRWPHVIITKWPYGLFIKSSFSSGI